MRLLSISQAEERVQMDCLCLSLVLLQMLKTKTDIRFSLMNTILVQVMIKLSQVF